MPSVSPEQQRLFGQAYAVKTGDLDPKDIDPKYRDRIVDLADSMSKKDLEDFAKTKYSEMKKESKEMKNLQSFENFISESIDMELNENAKKYANDAFLNLNNLSIMQEIAKDKEAAKELEVIMDSYNKWRKKYL